MARERSSRIRSLCVAAVFCFVLWGLVESQVYERSFVRYCSAYEASYRLYWGWPLPARRADVSEFSGPRSVNPGGTVYRKTVWLGVGFIVDGCVAAAVLLSTGMCLRHCARGKLQFSLRAIFLTIAATAALISFRRSWRGDLWAFSVMDALAQPSDFVLVYARLEGGPSWTALFAVGVGMYCVLTATSILLVRALRRMFASTSGIGLTKNQGSKPQAEQPIQRRDEP